MAVIVCFFLYRALFTIGLFYMENQNNVSINKCRHKSIHFGQKKCIWAALYKPMYISRLPY